MAIISIPLFKDLWYHNQQTEELCVKKEWKIGGYYLYLGSWLRVNYAYIDLNTDSDYVADSLFYRHKVRVGFMDEMVRDGEKYRVIFCRIRKKDREAFEKALAEIPNKMNLLGHTDYEAYCEDLMKKIQDMAEGKKNHE